MVKFVDDYNFVGKSIIIPNGKTVTGMFLLDEGGNWIPFSMELGRLSVIVSYDININQDADRSFIFTAELVSFEFLSI